MKSKKQHINTSNWLEQTKGLSAVLVGEAEKSASATLTRAIEQSDYPAILDFLNILVSSRLKNADTDTAQRYAELMLVIATVTDNTQRLADAQQLLGLTKAQGGEFAAGREHFHKALDIYCEIGCLEGQAKANTNIGNASFYLQEIVEAYKHYQNALEIAQHNGFTSIEANATSNIGTILLDTGDVTGAQYNFHKALILKKHIGDVQGEAATMRQIATAFMNEGNAENARKYGLLALSLYRSTSSIAGQAESLEQLIVYYCSSEQVHNAAQYVHELEGTIGSITNPRTSGRCYLALGMYYRLTGNITQGIYVVKTALEKLQTAAPNDKYTFQAHIQLSEYYEISNEAPLALYHLKTGRLLEQQYNTTMNDSRLQLTVQRLEVDNLRSKHEQERRINEELAAVNTQLTATKIRLQSIINSIEEEVYIVSPDGKITDYFAAATRLPDTILLTHIEEVLPQTEYSSFRNLLQSGSLQPTPMTFVHEIVHDGTSTWHQSTVSPFTVETTLIGAVVVRRDITEERQMQLRLKQYSDLLVSLNSAMSMYVANEVQPADMWNTMLDILLNVSGSQYGFIAQVVSNAENKPFLRTYSITNIAWNEETRKLYEDNITTGIEFHNVNTLFGHVVTTGKYVISNDPGNDPRRGGTPANHPPLTSFLGVPLYYGGELVGMYSVANKAQGYSEDDVEFLHPISSTLGFIIAGIREKAFRHHIVIALQQSEKKFRSVFDSLPIGVVITNNTTNILEINPKCEQLFGLSHSNGTKHSKSVRDITFLGPDGMPTTFQELQLLPAKSATELLSDYEVCLQSPTNEMLWLSVNAAPMDGLDNVLVMSFSDITTRKNAENEVKEQEQFLDGIFNGIDAAIVIFDVEEQGTEFRFNSANNTYEHYLNFPITQLVGKTVRETSGLFSAESSERLQQYCANCYATQAVVEYENMWPISVCEAWWLTRLNPVVNQQGIVYRIIASSFQITERVQTEHQLLKINAKLEDLNIELDNRVKERTAELQRALASEREFNILRETFAGVIAHQFRTPLTVILSSTEILRLYGKSLPEEKTDRIYQRIFDGISTIQHLLDAIKKVEDVSEKIRSMRIAPISCNFLLNNTIDNFVVSSKSTHTFIRNIQDNLVVLADEFMLRSVLLELFSNAVRYSRRDSTITINAQQQQEEICILVADNGIGIDAGEQVRIFEPFYRTKSTENDFGVGLGLAIVDRFTTAMNGRIILESTPGVGSTFTIILPVGHK